MEESNMAYNRCANLARVVMHSLLSADPHVQIWIDLPVDIVDLSCLRKYFWLAGCCCHLSEVHVPVDLPAHRAHAALRATILYS